MRHESDTNGTKRGTYVFRKQLGKSKRPKCYEDAICKTRGGRERKRKGEQDT